MSTVVVATSQAESAAVAAVEAHHAQLAGQLGALVVRLAAAAADPRTESVDRQSELVAFCRRELLPHAAAEERTIYPAAGDDPRAKLLVEAMIAEHVALSALVADLAADQPLVAAAATGRALQVLFDTHLAKENDLILPLLAASPTVSLAGLLEGMHELLGPEPHEQGSPTGESAAHTCSCGHEDGATHPELDARYIPHDIRHATIFGALSAVPAGGGMVLVAPHDPLPLLAQIEAREPGGFAVEYLEQGPDAWRLLFLRLVP